MRHHAISTLLAIGLLALAGCAGKSAVKPATDNAPATSAVGSGQTSGDASGAATAGAGGAAGAGGTATATQADNRIIYFDFDSSEIRPEFVDVVAVQARRIRGNASIRVRLEGHTDERGSREYNIGLGERRSQSVRRALLLQGVAEAQLATVSYGEERPAAAGSGEEAWAKNRRVEIVYLN